MSKPGRTGRLGRIEPLLDFLGGAELLRRVAQRLLGAMPPAALDGVADRTHQQVVVHLAFDQIVLRPGLHGLDRGALVVMAREHDDRHVAGVGVHGEEGFQPLAVGQAEVQQDDVELLLGAALDGRREQLDLDQVEGPVPAVAQQVAASPKRRRDRPRPAGS